LFVKHVFAKIIKCNIARNPGKLHINLGTKKFDSDETLHT
jgi:hypothetical protein